jgi:Ca2+-binding EF-hand superfamily protein
MDLVASGGVAFVSDVMLRLYDFFENDQESGELALELLRPTQVSKVDFLLFRICHKMAALGLSSEDVFAMIDTDAGGTIDENEFVEGIRSSLDLWISTQEIVEVFQAVAGGEELTKEAFLARCNFDWYHIAVKSDEYTVSKCEFLTLMASVYEARQKRDVAGLMALYQSQGEDPMSQATFKHIMKSLNRRTSASRIERIWNIGLSLSDTQGGLTMDIFIKTMLRYRTGPFAATKFCKALFRHSRNRDGCGRPQDGDS